MIPEKLVKYFQDNPSRFHILGSQMLGMHNGQWQKHVSKDVRRLHKAAALSLQKLAAKMISSVALTDEENHN